MDTLVKQALGLLLNTEDPQIYAKLLPDPIVWAGDLIPLLIKVPNPSLALMRPYAGSVFLATAPETDISKELLYLLGPLHEVPYLAAKPTIYDSNEFSRPLRLAMYAVRVFGNVEFLAKVPKDERETLVRLASISNELAKDQLDLAEDNKLYRFNEEDVLSKVRNFVGDYKLFLNGIASRANHWRDHLDKEAEAVLPENDM